MSRKALFHLLLAAALIAAVAAAWGLYRYYDRLPQRLSQQETIVLGQKRLVPGSQAALRVLVRDSKDGSPLSGADVAVSLQPKEGGPAVPLYNGKTGSSGAADVSFQVPVDAGREGTLIVEARSRIGADRVERAVTVERSYRVLLTTDKPIYQPGQVIHIRALALSTFDLLPAVEQPLEITIADGKGNKVLRKTLTTSDYGVASIDFQLANEVNSGAYKISASLGDTNSEKTVTVEHYVLPKFDLKLETGRRFYMPGERVEASLNARYFFGKPVSEGQVRIEGFTFDVQRNEVFTLEGVTDADGNFSFDFDLPPFLAGSDLDGGLARFYLQASVTDQAKHTQTSSLSLPVSASPLVIQAVPEGSSFRPGIENILYVLTSTPDGQPVQSDLRVEFMDSGQVIEMQTGEYGLAGVRFVPDTPYQSLSITARDASGSTAGRDFFFEGEWSEESVLLRPERPVYKVGEAMKLTILSSQPEGSVYLDIVREGQTVSTRSVEITQGKGEVTVDLSPDMYGTLELHAYKVLYSGAIIRDTRLVVVSPADDLHVTLAAAKDSHLPGENATINLQVRGAGGEGVPSAVGLAVVDEAVFALAESDPGFAKLYFLLEQEILTPRYDLHGYSIPDLMRGLPEPTTGLESAVSDAAQASLAEAVRQGRGAGSAFSLSANSHDEAMERAYRRRSEFFKGFSQVVLGVFLALPLALIALSVFTLIRGRVLGKGLLLWIGLLAVLIAFFVLVEPPGYHSFGSSPINRLGGWLSWLEFEGEWLLLGMALAALVGYITLIVIAARYKDLLLGWTLILLPVFMAMLVLFFFIVQEINVLDTDLLIVLVLIAIFAAPLALLVQTAGSLLRRRFIESTGLLLVALFLAFGVIPIASAAEGMSSRPAMAEAPAGGAWLAEPAAALPLAGGMVNKDDAGLVLEEEGIDFARNGDAQPGEPPRLRQYFPETMLWLPDAVTNPDGSLTVEIPVADSITTWRMTALASSQDGRLGSATAPLLVFQDFFIDLDLPLSLTVGDEIAIPVGVFNYLSEEQTVRLELKQADWFELQSEPEQELTIGANEISVAYFRIRATRFGMQPFQVTAWGSKMSDAIVKEVRVYPDGKEIRFTQSDRLTAGTPVQQAASIPAEAIPGTQKLMVKIYPGVISQVVEGLDSMLRMPYGCFEQTSSTTYPNLMVMDYLKTTRQAAPEVEMKAEEYINLGYQRLITFEVAGGGFSLFGNPPADRMLTAYGLLEFSDMSRVHSVDPDVIARAAEWLFRQQASDGSWENDQGLVHENTWSSLGNDRLPVTAYIAWSLIEAGYGDDARTQKALQYVREYQGQSEDPYVLGLVANALVAADLHNGGNIAPVTTAVLDRLAGMAHRDGEGAYWQSSIATFMGGEGRTGSIETTALAALALLRAEHQPDLANAALTFLVRQKDSFGTWHSTQATVLTLKALLQSVRGSGENTNADITITLNGGQARSLTLTPENFDVVQMVVFDDVNPGAENLIEIRAEGKGSMMYQITGSYYLPWDVLPRYPQLTEAADAVSIEVVYDRTELAVEETVTESVTVRLVEPGAKAEQAIIDLGIPPGFSVQTEDLDALVARFKDTPPDYNFPRVERYEMTGRQLILYITNLSADQPLEFSFRLRARFPLSVKSPTGNVYDYYNPDIAGIVPPQKLQVNP